MRRKVTAAIIEKAGKYLIAKRKPGGSLGGKWEFPGGKVEPGETPAAGLMRELFEEFEILVKVGDLLCTHPFANDGTEYELLAFRVEYLSGEFILHEHTEIRWIAPAEFAGFDLAPSDKAVTGQLFPAA